MLLEGSELHTVIGTQPSNFFIMKAFRGASLPLMQIWYTCFVVRITARLREERELGIYLASLRGEI